MNRSLLLLACLLPGCATLSPLAHPQDPLAWKRSWLAQHEGDLAVHDSGPARELGKGRTVLLVPGMTIGREFFEPMLTRLQRDGFSPLLYEDRDLLTTGVAQVASRLATRVEEIERETGETRIDIVAECVGGVTARYYVQVLDGGGRVGNLITFVSPHHGAVGAAFAASVTGWQGLKDIERGSKPLADLDDQPIPPGITFTSLYSANDELLVPRRTAVVRGAINVEFRDHPLGHFDGFWDDLVYYRILAALLDDPIAPDNL